MGSRLFRNIRIYNVFNFDNCLASDAFRFSYLDVFPSLTIFTSPSQLPYMLK